MKRKIFKRNEKERKITEAKIYENERKKFS